MKLTKPSPNASVAMMQAKLRATDLKIKQALEVNDNRSLDNLRKERGDMQQAIERAK